MSVWATSPQDAITQKLIAVRMYVHALSHMDLYSEYLSHRVLYTTEAGQKKSNFFDRDTCHFQRTRSVRILIYKPNFEMASVKID